MSGKPCKTGVHKTTRGKEQCPRCSPASRIAQVKLSPSQVQSIAQNVSSWSQPKATFKESWDNARALEDLLGCQIEFGEIYSDHSTHWARDFHASAPDGISVYVSHYMYASDFDEGYDEDGPTHMSDETVLIEVKRSDETLLVSVSEDLSSDSHYSEDEAKASAMRGLERKIYSFAALEGVAHEVSRAILEERVGRHGVDISNHEAMRHVGTDVLTGREPLSEDSLAAILIMFPKEEK